jgi:hypothetical protein
MSLAIRSDRPSDRLDVSRFQSSTVHALSDAAASALTGHRLPEPAPRVGTRPLENREIRQAFEEPPAIARLGFRLVRPVHMYGCYEGKRNADL